MCIDLRSPLCPSSQVHFTLELQPNKMQECLAEGLESKFKMSSKFSTRQGPQGK